MRADEWERMWRGTVTFSATGADTGRFLTACAATGVNVWDTQSDGVTLIGHCLAKQYRHLRKPARKYGVRLRVDEKKGWPFWWKKHRIRPGVAVGVAVFFTIIRWLSGYVWAVEVHGSDRLEAEVTAAVAEMGVYVGAPISGVDARRIQLASLNRLPQLAWIAVNMEGSIAHVQVEERKLPDKQRISPCPANVLAAVDGEIVSMTVWEGEPVAKVGDGVTAGTLLVSGVRTAEYGEFLVRAAAEIRAKTTHTATVTVPLTDERLERTGRMLVRPAWHLFSLTVPWFAEKELPAHYAVEKRESWWRYGGHRLPIGVSRTYVAEQAIRSFTRTEEQATALAFEQMAEAERELTAGKTVLSRREQVDVTKTAVSVTVAVDCLEDIAVQVDLTAEKISKKLDFGGDKPEG